MKIGQIDFGERPLFLAPMEDVTDIGFRRLCKRFGAKMVYTEFVSFQSIILSLLCSFTGSVSYMLDIHHNTFI